MSQHADRTGLYIMVFITLLLALEICDEVKKLHNKIDAIQAVVMLKGVE